MEPEGSLPHLQAPATCPYQVFYPTLCNFNETLHIPRCKYSELVPG